MEMEEVIGTENLVKRYGKVKALNNLNVQVEKGSLVGLLGPNGSGKSTFMRLASGQSRPTSGEVYVKGMRPGVETKKIISYSPEENHLYSWMKVKEAVSFFKDFFLSFDDEKTWSMLEFMKLPPDRYISELSKGMAARLKLALALSWSAELVLLDEPLSGIDPASREKITHGILMEFGKGEGTMVITTHIVDEIEPLLNRVIFLKEGEVFLEGEPDQLREQYGYSLDQIFRRELA